MRVLWFLFAVALAYADPATIRGKLIQVAGKPPALEMGPGKSAPLDGDKDTLGVLNDKRLSNEQLELRGRFEGARFIVDPIHTKAMHVYRQGKALLITYWCDVCAIRTYTPGICWCCQEETALDLRSENE
jgi:hypothetical protein